MKHLYDRPLGACAPCGFLFKNATFDVGSLISSGLSFAGQMATNQINAERAASDMATYLNMVKTQRKWQKEDQLTSMLNTKALMDYQNAYDSPSAQRKRYEEAGLNPYLAAGSGQIGSGNSMSIPNPNLGERAGVSPIQRPALDNPVSSAADKLFNASALKSQRMASMGNFLKSLPELVRGLGKDGAKRIASSIFGRDIDMSIIEDRIASEDLIAASEAKLNEVKAELYKQFGSKEAELRIANGEAAFNESIARVGKMASDVKLNEGELRKISSEIIRNVADAWKLRREGDVYVANAATVNALRSFVVASARANANMLTTRSFLSGSEPDTPLFDYFHSGDYGQKLMKSKDIMMSRNADAVWTAVDKFFGDYVKIMGSPAGNGSSTTTMYTEPSTHVSGF